MSAPCRRTSALAATGLAAALVLSACGSDSSAPAPSTPAQSTAAQSTPAQSTPAQSTPAPPANGSGAAAAGSPGTCPTAAPAPGGVPSWQYQGNTGSISVFGPTATTAPRVDVVTPFSVDDSEDQTLVEGNGPEVSPTATVLVCYQGVNGRDGSVFDSSFERGTPVRFPLSGVVPGFQKAIVGEKVGSTVAVAVTPADGYPQGQPAAGITGTDSLVFTLTILDATG